MKEFTTCFEGILATRGNVDGVAGKNYNVGNDSFFVSREFTASIRSDTTLRRLKFGSLRSNNGVLWLPENVLRETI